MAFSKDTIRLVVQFKDFNGISIVPQDIKLVIYDTKKEILETITTNIIQESGSFYHDYETPDKDFIFEYSGFFNMKKVLARQKVMVKFTKGED
ncbi:MAG TPA: hypothetical protein K8V56_10620 [Sporosarcina psychrophila]|uniref:Uncharacterized protein n=1 Tax=Sporosarcina psychrophila TaxID=1476 RepID=A0A921FYQ9_SPOPS|nr:hypothetical protein [Sporosarcina psychrophila]